MDRLHSRRERHHHRAERADGVFSDRARSAIRVCPPFRYTLVLLDRRRLNGGGDALLLPERADAADLIAGQALGVAGFIMLADLPAKPPPASSC